MTARRCSWENCSEDAEVRVLWARDPDAKVVHYNVAHYCGAHADVAKANGARAYNLRELDAAGVARFAARIAHLPRST